MTQAAAGIRVSVGSAEYGRLARRARRLSWLTLAILAIEGTVAILAGVLAGSIALIGFGLDSAIEALASIIIVWRFTGRRMLSEESERRAQKLVAVSFFVLAPYVSVEAIRSLIEGNEAETSLLGVGITTASLLTMPPLGLAKQRLGARLGSAATAGEGKQNLLCAYLAAAVLFGLLGNALFGLWWLDPLVGIVIAVVAVQEGLESWGGGQDEAE